MSEIVNSIAECVCVGTGRFVSKGEDKDYSNVSHVEQGLSDVGSFSVFDGHYGDRSSSLCAQHLNPSIMARQRKMEDKLLQCIHAIEAKISTSDDNQLTEIVKFLQSEEMRDAIFVESIRASVQIMDCELRKVDKSGTTAVSLFARKRKMDGGVRILVSNIGDSRCVLFSPKKGEIHKSASTQSLSTVEDAETKYDEGPSSFSKLTGTFMKMMKNVPSIKKREGKKLSAFCSTRDHSLAHPSERKRVGTKGVVDIDWSPFPTEILNTSDQFYEDESGASTDGPVVHIAASPVMEQSIDTSGDDSLDNSLNGNDPLISYDELNQSIHFSDIDVSAQLSASSSSGSLSSRPSSDSDFSPFGHPIGKSPQTRDSARKMISVPIPIPRNSSNSSLGKFNHHCLGLISIHIVIY